MGVVRSINYISTNYMIRSVSLLVIALLTFITNFPMFHSWFGIIDDHEIVKQLGNQSSFFKIPQRLISDTEIGNFGDSSRFRPFYYTLKFILISIFGDWVGGYYIFRTLVQAFCSFLVFCLLCPTTKSNVSYPNLLHILVASISLLVAICVTSLGAWTDISLRLGPSELELTFGVLLTAYASTRITLLAKSSGLSTGKSTYFFLCLGVFIATGAKENGVITLLPLLFITVIYFRSLILPSKLNLIALLLTAFQAFFVILQILLVIVRGSDVYGEPRSFQLLAEALSNKLTGSNFSLLLIATGVLVMLLRHSSFETFRRLSIAVFFNLIYLSEGIFYTESTVAGRYMILSQICLLVVPSLSLIGISSHFVNHSLISINRKIVAFLLLNIGLFNYLSPWDDLMKHNQLAKAKLQGTSIFRSEIDALKSKLNSFENAPILIHSFNPDSDFERIFSIVQFIRYVGFKNDIYLKTWSNEASNLAQSLESNSFYGSGTWEINPLNFLSREKVSLCIFFEVELDNLDIPTKSSIDQKCPISQQIIS